MEERKPRLNEYKAIWAHGTDTTVITSRTCSLCLTSSIKSALCCGFFRTAFHSSDKMQHTGSMLSDLKSNSANIKLIKLEALYIYNYRGPQLWGGGGGGRGLQGYLRYC